MDGKNLNLRELSPLHMSTVVNVKRVMSTWEKAYGVWLEVQILWCLFWVSFLDVDGT